MTREFEKAIKDYTVVIGLDSNDSRALWLRGSAWSEVGERKKALKDYDAAIRLSPTHAKLRRERGDILFQMRRFENALKEYEATVRMDPSDASGCNSLAWVATCPQDQLRDGKRAIELARTACRLKGEKDPDCLDTLAAAYAEIGDFQAAVVTQRTMIEFELDNEKLNDARARLQLYESKRAYRHEE